MQKRSGWVLLLTSVVLLAGVVASVVVGPVLAAPVTPDPLAPTLEYLGRVQRETDKQSGVRLAGTVVEVVEPTIVLDVSFGQLDVQTDDRTRFVVPGVDEPRLADITTGMTVAVQGRRQGRTFRAQMVLVLPENGGRIQGEVAVIGDATFDVNTKDGLVTVTVDAQTRFRLPDVEDATLEDLTVSARVNVTGLHQDDGAFLAKLVTAVRPRIQERKGTVVAVDADSLTVQLPNDREVVLIVNNETEVFVPGIVDATIADVMVDAVVRACAEIVSQDEIVVQRIIVVPPGAAVLVGVVDEVAGSTVQVETRMGQVIAVETDASTRVIVPGIESPTLVDLRVGEKVRVGGAWLSETAFSGWAIQVSKDGRVGEVQGRLLALGDAVFTVGSPHGTVSVIVDAETRYGVPGIESPAFDDLAVGQWITIRGLFEEDGSLRARGVGVKR